MKSDMREGVWEDFTTALIENRIFDAELLLDSMSQVKGEAAWDDTINMMYDEWALWLTGKSQYNYHEDKQIIHA